MEHSEEAQQNGDILAQVTNWLLLHLCVFRQICPTVSKFLWKSDRMKIIFLSLLEWSLSWNWFEGADNPITCSYFNLVTEETIQEELVVAQPNNFQLNSVHIVRDQIPACNRRQLCLCLVNTKGVTRTVTSVFSEIGEKANNTSQPYSLYKLRMHNGFIKQIPV